MPAKAFKSREAGFLTWLIDGEPVGCTNTNQIAFGKKAFMHLHVWKPINRKKGIGTEFVKKSLVFYFENLQLENLILRALRA